MAPVDDRRCSEERHFGEICAAGAATESASFRLISNALSTKRGQRIRSAVLLVESSGRETIQLPSPRERDLSSTLAASIFLLPISHILEAQTVSLRWVRNVPRAAYLVGTRVESGRCERQQDGARTLPTAPQATFTH